MRKEKMVTRTVELTICEVMCLNTETAEVTVQEYKVSVQGNQDPLKLLKKQHETDTFKLVSVQNTRTETILYGMPESVFIQNATVLPPRGVKE